MVIVYAPPTVVSMILGGFIGYSGGSIMRP